MRSFLPMASLSLLVAGNGRYLHVRSASRLGSSDLRVNRKRGEDIRTAVSAVTQN